MRTIGHVIAKSCRSHDLQRLDTGQLCRRRETHDHHAKAIAHMCASDMLWDDASAAQAIPRDYKPPMRRAEYPAFQRGINRTETFDGAAE